jgi:hypothetical protein
MCVNLYLDIVMYMCVCTVGHCDLYVCVQLDIVMCMCVYSWTL